MPERDSQIQPAVFVEPLPDWASPSAPAVPGSRWLSMARRWLQPQAPSPSLEASPAAAPAALSERLRQAAAGRADAPILPAAVMDRLRRCVAHAVRHPGFGFALLRLDFQLLDPQGQGASALAALGRQAERRLRQSMRPGDALELLPRPASFVMVLDGVGCESDLRTIVGRLQAELTEPFRDGDQPLSATPRLGVVFGEPGQVPRPAELLAQLAERALTDARAGAWQLAGAGAPRPDAERLQRALAGDGVVPGFEPQVDLASGEIRALGVQLAWRDGSQRRIDAGECGELQGLDELLLQRSLQLSVGSFIEWRRADASRQGCRLALPVAAALVCRAGWADDFVGLLQDTGLAATDLQLEIPPTLSLLDRNLPARLQALVRQGVALALDDFGTGRSSLSALAKLPLAVLKIDRSFIPQAHELEHHRVLLESSLRMAAQFGIATLGKGLQTSPQLSLLRGLGCQRGEGAAAASLLRADALKGLPRLPQPRLAA